MFHPCGLRTVIVIICCLSRAFIARASRSKQAGGGSSSATCQEHVLRCVGCASRVSQTINPRFFCAGPFHPSIARQSRRISFFIRSLHNDSLSRTHHTPSDLSIATLRTLSSAVQLLAVDHHGPCKRRYPQRSWCRVRRAHTCRKRGY